MRTTISLTHRRGSGFLADYFVGRIVRAGDNVAGYPTIRYGRDSSGQKVLIKTWADSGPLHTALRPFWREEIRSLRALSAKHNSDQLLTRTGDAGDDDAGFHLVVLCGNRRPIADLLRRQDWKRLSNSNRIDLWNNFARLAGALQLLHDQGLTHRNLDAWAVLARDPEHPDFQLTGFEWTTRLTPNSEEPGRLSSDDIASQLRLEWKAYARLTRDLLSQSRR